jgi:peptide/nickel transport system permease protein
MSETLIDPLGSGNAASLPAAGARAVEQDDESLFRRFVSDKVAVVALLLLLTVILIAVLAPLLAPYNPNQQHLTKLFLPAGSPGFLLGTDDLGRDQLSRLMFGARISLIAAAIAVGVGALLGVPIGLLAGYFGGLLDTVVSRINEALMSVPALILALTIVTVLGRGLVNSMVAIGIVLAPRFFRLARAVASDLRTETFIEASVSLGCTTSRILTRHVFPNALSPIVIQLALTSGTALIAEATLSFLGAGVRPPTASWGSMIGDAYNQLYIAPHLAYAPGLCITLSSVAFMLVGEGLRRAVGPRRMVAADAR